MSFQKFLFSSFEVWVELEVWGGVLAVVLPGGLGGEAGFGEAGVFRFGGLVAFKEK